VRCAEHATTARLINTPNGQVRYVAVPANAREAPPSADFEQES
jgi:hypothetical protein